MQEMLEQIKEDITKNPIILYMKGTKEKPACGFSVTSIEILKHCDVEFEVRNVLESDALRQAIKEFSDWPTLPQLYVNGEFIGGCDLMLELFQKGELQELLKKV